MKFLFSVVLFCLFSCLPEYSFSQITTAPGFIITNQGDSLRGKLEYVNTNISAKRIFIPEGTEKLTIITPELVKDYQVNPEVNFKTLSLKGKKVFMQVISEGQLNLYKYRGELFAKTPADSLLHLTGGRKTEMKDGKKYAVVDYTYKKQLRQALNTPAFDNKLNNLVFDEEHISNLSREINGQPQSEKIPQLENKYQFEIRLGFTANAFTLQNIPYSQDSLSSNETFFGVLGNKSLPAEKISLSHITAGGFVKSKIGKKYSYLKAGAVLNKALAVRKTQTRNLYKGFVFSNSGPDHPKDTIGKVIDTYTYKMNTLEIPLSYYAELSDGKFRPFVDLGLTTKIYSGANVTLKREIYDREKLLRTETGQMHFPTLTVGPMLGAGCKYLLSAERSLIFGINMDGFIPYQLSEATWTSLHKSGSFGGYIAYGF